jgi:hypothetical protein
MKKFILEVELEDGSKCDGCSCHDFDPQYGVWYCGAADEGAVLRTPDRPDWCPLKEVEMDSCIDWGHLEGDKTVVSLVDVNPKGGVSMKMIALDPHVIEDIKKKLGVEAKVNIPMSEEEKDYYTERLGSTIVCNWHTAYMEGSFGYGEEGKNKFIAQLEDLLGLHKKEDAIFIEKCNEALEAVPEIGTIISKKKFEETFKWLKK